MNKFIRTVTLLLISMFGYFKAFALNDNNAPIDYVSLARDECSNLLQNGQNVRLIFLSDNDDNPNNCLIMGNQKFLVRNANRRNCQWVRCCTLVSYISSLGQNRLDYVWNAEEFSNLVFPLSEDEFGFFANSFPSLQYLANYNCHHGQCDHEHPRRTT